MLSVIWKFILFYIFVSIALAFFKRIYYSISKKLITKTTEGTKLHWALNLFVKDGKKLDSDDYFLVSTFAAICTIYL